MTPRRGLAAVLAGALAAAACGSAGDDELSAGSVIVTAPTAETAAPVTAAPVTAAPTTAAPTTVAAEADDGAGADGGDAEPTTVGPACAAVDAWFELGEGRGYQLVAPDIDTATAAVVVLHGSGGDSGGIRFGTEIEGRVLLGGGVTVYPEGTPRGGGFAWSAKTAKWSTDPAIDDVAYLVEVFDALVDEHCVDPARIALAGFSNGGGMTVLAVCDDRMRGRVAFAAAVTAAVDEGTLADCDEADAVPFVVYAARDDATVLYDPGDDEGDEPWGQVRWFEAVATAANACPTGLDAEPTAVAGSHDIHRLEGCAEAAEYVVTGVGGHRWPDAGTYPLDEQITAAIGLT